MHNLKLINRILDTTIPFTIQRTFLESSVAWLEQMHEGAELTYHLQLLLDRQEDDHNELYSSKD